MPIRRSLATFLILGATLQAQAPAEKIVERYKQMLAANPAEGTALDRLWKLYLDQGQTAQLIEEYRAGGTFASELVLGQLLRKAGNLDEAQAAFQRAAALDDANPQPFLALARMTGEAGKAREAATSYEKAVSRMAKEDPQLPETLMQLGAQWLALGDLTKAAEAWEQTVALNPGDLEVRRRLADTYAQNHLPIPAVAHLDYIIEHSPPAERAQALQQQARIHQGAGDQDAAIAALEKALELTTPGNWLRAELQSQLIRLHQRYHRTGELEERWKRYAGENPRDLAGYLQLIDLYERTGDLEQQRGWLERLAQLVPKNAEYRQRLARLLVQMDQVDAAAAAYDVLIKEQPTNAEFVFERARLDVQRDAAPAARERIARLLKARESDESIRAKALEFYEQNHLTEAIEQHLVEEAKRSEEEPLLALAGFYFSQRREADAARVLERLTKREAKPAEQAATRFKIAQLLRTQNQFTAAIAQLEAAVKLQPESRESQMLLGELQVAFGQPAAAQAAYERALELAKTPAEEAESDQKFFEVLRGQSPEIPALPRGRSLGTIVLSGPDAPMASPALAAQLAKMEAAARAKPDEAEWLRLARWRLWMRDVNGGQAALGQALAKNPKSIPAFELLVKFATLDGPTSAAVVHLLKLAELDPPNRASYQRRAGQIELQAGRVKEALAIFTQLVQETPGNVETLTDLALTQQRGEQWKEALETWRQVYALSPLSKKRDAFTPLLRVLERLEMHPQAAELRLKAIETEADERQQFVLFNDLLTHCEKHGLLDWLRAEFENRRQLRADDYFTEMALGRILKVSGNKAAAFEVLADASYAAPNQAEALPELIHEAEELRKLDAAVQLQSQLLRIVPQTSPEGFEKLAQLQEKRLDFAGAAKTWDRIVAKFPRDSGALSHAIEFQLRGGTPQRAMELLRKVRALDPSNLQTLATLAELSREAGEDAEAESCLEQILKVAKPEAPGDAIRFPALRAEDAQRLQTAYLSSTRQRRTAPSSEAFRALQSFWVDESAGPKVNGDREHRLNAIRALAQLVRERGDAAALKAWIERWRVAGAPSEALWALFFAGAGGPLLDRMETLPRIGSDDVRASNAYVWLAMQTGEFARLGAWLRDRRRTSEEREYLLIALGQYITLNEGKIAPALVDELFPKASSPGAWRAAVILASRNRFREAIQLGRRVFDSATTQRVVYGRELAHWHLYVGEVQAARDVLQASIAHPAESFDADAYGALREAWLLRTEGDRAAFAAGYLGEIDEQRQPLHFAIAGTILSALAGDEEGARKHLDSLLSLRPLASDSGGPADTAALRRWQMLFDAGAQLQAWHFDTLAIYLWEKALADQALIELQDEATRNIARDLRHRLFALRAARGSSLEAPTWIEAFQRTSAREGLTPLGEMLEAFGATRRAIEVYRVLWERDPANGQTLRNLLKACQAGNDTDLAEAALRKAVAVAATRPNDGSQREFTLLLADLLERKGALAGTRRLLSEAVEKAPGDTVLLMRLAQLHERAGQAALAEAVYRRLLTIDQANPAARLALAGLLDGQSHTEAAAALLVKGGTPDIEARLAQLQLKANQIDEALATLDRIAPPQHVNPTLQIATALAERGERQLARGVVQNAIVRTADAAMSFPLYCKAVELLAPVDSVAQIKRELRRARQAAGEQPALLGSYLDFARLQSTRLGIENEFAAELRTLWADGAGPLQAGAALLADQLDRPKDAERTLQRILARAESGESWLHRLIATLESASHPELAVQVRERLAQLNPLNSQFALDWAQALAKLSRPAEAHAVLEALAARCVIEEGTTGKVAQAFVALGDTDRARKLFERALGDDPYARNFPAHLDFARLQVAAKDFAGARTTLRAAFLNPANREFAVIADWLETTNHIEDAERELAALELSPAQRTGVRRELFARFARDQRLAPALAIIEAYPQTLTIPMARTLREMAKAAAEFERVAPVFERITAETPDAAEFTLEQARLLGDWAEADLAASNPEAAIAHLRRGHELHPEIFEITRQLAILQSKSGAGKAAVGTLESYLEVATDSAEVEKAKELLGRVKSGEKL